MSISVQLYSKKELAATFRSIIEMILNFITEKNSKLFLNNYLLSLQFMAKAKSKIEIRNKKASFEYEFLENYTAGIVLTGTEIKSIRAGKASLVDSYCYFSGGELYVKNMHIAEYWWGTFNRHDPKRDRKLLLTRKELRKLSRAVKEKGLTIVTRRLFISETGYAKLDIALARGKKEYDKRESIKEKDLRRYSPE